MVLQQNTVRKPKSFCVNVNVRWNYWLQGEIKFLLLSATWYLLKRCFCVYRHSEAYYFMSGNLINKSS